MISIQGWLGEDDLSQNHAMVCVFHNRRDFNVVCSGLLEEICINEEVTLCSGGSIAQV